MHEAVVRQCSQTLVIKSSALRLGVGLLQPRVSYASSVSIELVILLSSPVSDRFATQLLFKVASTFTPCLFILLALLHVSVRMPSIPTVTSKLIKLMLLLPSENTTFPSYYSLLSIGLMFLDLKRQVDDACGRRLRIRMLPSQPYPSVILRS